VVGLCYNNLITGLSNKQEGSCMVAFEFTARIKDGVIEIPENYRERLRLESIDGLVRIIVLTKESNKPVSESNLIEQLLANPLQISDFTPLSRDESHERN
jgi:hypothetical protein